MLGRSNIVGMPAALLLIGKNATVTVCHSRTRDLPGTVRQADILIAAIGKTEMVRGDWIKPGAAIIDVGINAVPDATKKSGQRAGRNCPGGLVPGQRCLQLCHWRCFGRRWWRPGLSE